MTFLVLGIDAATWTIIKPNIDKLQTFKKLMKEGKYKTLTLKEKPISASAWCSIFTGKRPEEHGNLEFVMDDKLRTREDINVDFIWDVLSREGFNVKAMNIPFVIPTYNFNCDFKPIGYGLPETEEEWQQELNIVTQKSKEILEEGADLLCVAYSLLDRIQHFHWGEPVVLEWYIKVDKAISEIVSLADKLILVSDHGFCNREEAPVKTLPEKTPRGEIKGEHHPDAILITKNINYEINTLQDIFHAIREEIKK